MEAYTLYQVAFDGEYVKDSEHAKIEQAQQTSADMGSKWIFYPLSVIVKGQTIKETGGQFLNMETDECLLSKKYEGKRFTTLLKDLQKLTHSMEGMNYEQVELFLLDQ